MNSSCAQGHPSSRKNVPRMEGQMKIFHVGSQSVPGIPPGVAPGIVFFRIAQVVGCHSENGISKHQRFEFPEWSWRSSRRNWWRSSGEVWKEIFELLLLGENRQKHFPPKTPPQISPSNFTTRSWVVAGPKFLFREWIFEFRELLREYPTNLSRQKITLKIIFIIWGQVYFLRLFLTLKNNLEKSANWV